MKSPPTKTYQPNPWPAALATGGGGTEVRSSSGTSSKELGRDPFRRAHLNKVLASEHLAQDRGRNHFRFERVLSAVRCESMDFPGNKVGDVDPGGRLPEFFIHRPR